MVAFLFRIANPPFGICLQNQEYLQVISLVQINSFKSFRQHTEHIKLPTKLPLRPWPSRITFLYVSSVNLLTSTVCSVHTPDHWAMDDHHKFLLGLSGMVLSLPWVFRFISKKRPTLDQPPSALSHGVLSWVVHLYGLFNSRVQYFAEVG